MCSVLTLTTAPAEQSMLQSESILLVASSPTLIPQNSSLHRTEFITSYLKKRNQKISMSVSSHKGRMSYFLEIFSLLSKSHSCFNHIIQLNWSISLEKCKFSKTYTTGTYLILFSFFGFKNCSLKQF